MPIQVDVPNGIGAENDWGLYGTAPNKIAAVASDNGDTDVIYGFSHGRNVIQLYTFSPLLGVTDHVTAASISCRVREYQPGNASRSFHMYWNSALVGANLSAAIHAPGAGYTTQTYAAGGAALAAVNGEHGVYMNGTSGTGWEVWVTHVYRTVNFDYSGAAISADVGFSHLISSIAAMIGANLLLRDMPRLSKALGNVRLRPDEYEPALRAWKTRKNPAWSA